MERFAQLSEADKTVLDQAIRNSRNEKTRRDLIHEGDITQSVFLILEGIGCRYKILPDGKRQIFAFLLPGDLGDQDLSVLYEMDHSIGTLSACKVVQIPRETMNELNNHPAIARALRWSALVDAATSRQWLVNTGRRPADRRVAHLLCELLVRLQAVGLATKDGYDLHLTQAGLADATGLSVVHANRVLQQLRREKLIRSHNTRLDILDFGRLKVFAGFNPNYLQLANRRDRNDPGQIKVRA